METKEIIKLSKDAFGMAPVRIEKLAGAGSSRRYYRIYLDKIDKNGSCRPVPLTAIVTVGVSEQENRAFITLAEIFRKVAISRGTFRVPEIFAVSKSGRIYLQEDLGEISFLSYLKDLQDSAQGDTVIEEKEAVKKVLDGLLDLQLIPDDDWIDSVSTLPFGERRVISDLYYFKNCFLRPSGINFSEDQLDEEFEEFAHYICGYDAELEGFMYRDFQTRNIIHNPEDVPGFIDFQGGMAGPVIYDIVSFLWQAKANFSDVFRKEMLRYYTQNLAERRNLEVENIEKYIGRFVVLRTLQALGAYGFRGLVEHKAHFIESIPNALDNLRSLLDDGELKSFPELERCCREITGLEKFNPEPHGCLRVEILSFSFKKGYPENLTGNGGGFVFDCRWMHNPGRYDEYKSLTGYDAEVITFLEERGEVQEFMKNVRGLVFPAVEVYSRRGFKDLQIAFGCTGGRHRSVYCANSLVKSLRDSFPNLEIRLIHREQDIEERFFIKKEE